MNNIESFINTINNSFIGSEVVYMRGSCYQFYLILQQVFPQAIPWYSEDHDHIVTCIDGVLYDITGAVIVDNSFTELKNFDERIQSSVKNYKFNGLIDHVECPNCNDIFKFVGHVS